MTEKQEITLKKSTWTTPEYGSDTEADLRIVDWVNTKSHNNITRRRIPGTPQQGTPGGMIEIDGGSEGNNF